MNLLHFYSTWAFLNHTVKKQAAFSEAKSLVKSKGIINLGAVGNPWSPLASTIAVDPLVKVNLDKKLANLPNFVHYDMENPLPFSNKQFDVSFASHSLEHLDNWKQALNEMVRVADHVIIVLPHPLSTGGIRGLLGAEHKQSFSFSDMREMERLYPTVKVYA